MLETLPKLDRVYLYPLSEDGRWVTTDDFGLFIPSHLMSDIDNSVPAGVYSFKNPSGGPIWITNLVTKPEDLMATVFKKVNKGESAEPFQISGMDMILKREKNKYFDKLECYVYKPRRLSIDDVEFKENQKKKDRLFVLLPKPFLDLIKKWHPNSEPVILNESITAMVDTNSIHQNNIGFLMNVY